MKKIFGIIALIFIVVLVFVWINLGSKTVRGQILDNTTGKGIEGVSIKTSQRGWGISNGSLVWDKDFVSTATSDQDGRFTINYNRGGMSVHLLFSKDGYSSIKPGYPLSDTYVDFWEQPTIKLQKN